ncbi:MAG TPA: DNA replication and repair protein RecF, partial [Chitinophagaceae bacterium]|nr:DNA replication and repair protein RecF [Chitinophagaceae bacterium]
IGRFPCIFIAPDDTELISGAGELRRRFLDTMIGQVSSDYLQSLIRYNRVLQQRNALLKLWALSGTVDTALLDVYSQQLAEQGTLIYHQRKNYLEHYIPLVKLLYATLCMEQEPCSIQYQSALNDHLMYPMLQSALEKDRVLQRTTAGIHRDDLVFKLNDMPLKQVASQGQRKSFLFALKLAQYEMVSRLTGKQALLLLDDLFEKLDEKRSRQLTEYILQCSGQVWITDTHVERLLPAFEQSEQEVTWISLTNE